MSCEGSFEEAPGDLGELGPWKVVFFGDERTSACLWESRLSKLERLAVNIMIPSGLA